MSKWMMPNPIYKQLRDEYWEISKGTLTQNIEMDFLSWAVETSRNRDVLHLLLLSLVIERCMQLDIFYMHWKSKLSSDLCMKLTVEEERRLLLDDAHSLGIIHRYPLESFRPNTFTLSPLKGQAQSYIKFMTCVLSLLDPTADKGDISDDMHRLVGENGDIAEKDHKQFWKDNGLSFPRKIAFKHCTQLTVDRISFLLKELQMNINASLLLFEFVFHGTPLSHQEICNIIAIDNHVIEDEEKPLLSVRTKCKVCYCHAMDTATTFFSKSIHVMRFVMKEKLKKSDLTDQEKARVTALVNFKVDEYLPAAIARLLFDKPNLEKIHMSNTQVDESTKSSISQWIKVPYMNKCQCDGRPQHGFIRSCLFCGLDAIHKAKNMQLNEKVQSLLFSPHFAYDNANSVINEFIDFFYHMIRLVINDKTCSLKPEKGGKNKGIGYDDPSEPNVITRDEEPDSNSVHENSKCDKQKIGERVKNAGRFVLDSVEVDGQGCDGEKSSGDIDADETDDQDHEIPDDNDESETDTVHIDNDSDDNHYDIGNEVDSKAYFRFKNAEVEERRTNKAEARLLKRNNPEQAPVSVAECVPSLTVIQVMEIAKKFDPKGSFSHDLSSFLQWMFSFSTGPSLTLINDFAQHGCNLSSKAVHTQNEGSYVNIVPSLTDIDEIEMSQKHKVTSVKDLDQSVEDVRRNNCERNGGESLVPPEAIVTTRKRTVHTKKEDKSALSVKKARDTLSAKLSDEGKNKLSNASEVTIRTRKIKDKDAKDEAATKLPVVKRLKTKENDTRLFAEFFGK